MKIVEGQFGGAGDRPAGVLGLVQKHWDVVSNRARSLGITEQWIIRAVVRGLIESAGGLEQEGRMILSRPDEPEGGIEATVENACKKFVQDRAARADLLSALETIDTEATSLRTMAETRLGAVEQDIGGLKMLVVELRSHIRAQEEAIRAFSSSIQPVAVQPAEEQKPAATQPPPQAEEQKPTTASSDSPTDTVPPTRSNSRRVKKQADEDKW